MNYINMRPRSPQADWRVYLLLGGIFLGGVLLRTLPYHGYRGVPPTAPQHTEPRYVPTEPVYVLAPHSLLPGTIVYIGPMPVPEPGTLGDVGAGESDPELAVRDAEAWVSDEQIRELKPESFAKLVADHSAVELKPGTEVAFEKSGYRGVFVQVKYDGELWWVPAGNLWIEEHSAER